MLISNDRPAYRILATAGFYGPDDTLYPEGAAIYFEDEPNEDMEPLNQPAREAMTAYLDKLDRLGEIAAKAAGRAFVGRPRTLDGAIALAREDARRVQLVQGDGGVPLMGAHKRGPKRVEAIVADAETPQDGRRGKLSIAQ
jgi:hypothetical protein